MPMRRTSSSNPVGYSSKNHILSLKDSFIYIYIYSCLFTSDYGLCVFQIALKDGKLLFWNSLVLDKIYENGISILSKPRPLSLLFSRLTFMKIKHQQSFQNQEFTPLIIYWQMVIFPNWLGPIATKLSPPVIVC